MSVQATPRTILDRTVAAGAAGATIRIAVVLLGAAVTAAASQVTTPVPFTAVPFTLTPMAVLLTGAALGSRLGALSQTVYLTLGALGVAVFAPSLVLPPGPARLLGPTGGYLLSYPLAAFVTGFLSERGWDRRYLSSFAAMVAGLAVIYIGGVSWLIAAFQTAPSQAVTAGIVPFVALDLLKAAAAAMILPQVWRLSKS